MEDSLAWLVTCGVLAVMTGIEFGMSNSRGRGRGALDVLVIESDERLRLDLCAFVRRRGHAAVAAANADTAVRLARRRPPDLVLMDQAAASAARHLRAAGGHPEIVLMTRGHDPVLSARIGAFAIDDVLPKPLRVEGLSAVLDRCRGA